jgi:hypothetical protein
MKRTNRAIIGVICVGVLALAVLLLTGTNREQVQRLPDGSVLCLRKVKFGATNEFVHGTPFQKVFRSVLPTEGFRFGKRRILPPRTLRIANSGHTTLTAEIQLKKSEKSQLPVRPGVGSASPEYRWVLRDDQNDHIQCTKRFLEFTAYDDGYFLYATTSSFPRDSKRLFLVIERRSTEKDNWRQFAKFTLINPATSEIRSWAAQPAPLIKRIDDFEFALHEASWDTSIPWDGSGARLGLEIKYRGAAQSDWSMEDVICEDASGNVVSTGREGRGHWRWYWPQIGLDPRFPWRIGVNFCPNFGWRDSEVCAVRLPASLSYSTQTNFNHVPLQIEYSGGRLSVTMLTNKADLRLTFISAKDQAGMNVQVQDRRGSQYNLWQQFYLFGDEVVIEATFAVSRIYHVAFYAQPKLFESSNPRLFRPPDRPPLYW